MVMKAINIHTMLSLNRQDLGAFTAFSIILESHENQLQMVNFKDKSVKLSLAFHYLILGNAFFKV
jgi:hypothetical protein